MRPASAPGRVPGSGGGSKTIALTESEGNQAAQDRSGLPAVMEIAPDHRTGTVSKHLLEQVGGSVGVAGGGVAHPGSLFLGGLFQRGWLGVLVAGGGPGVPLGVLAELA